MTTKSFIDDLIVFINPYKALLFKKYGTPEKINSILNEIAITKEYEDKTLIISKNYICDKKNFDNLVAVNDVLGAHKYVHRVNFFVDYYGVIVVDKYAKEIVFLYSRKDEIHVDSAINIINEKCKNAEIGYTQKEFEHIEKNKIDLPSCIPENQNEYGGFAGNEIKFVNHKNLLSGKTIRNRLTVFCRIIIFMLCVFGLIVYIRYKPMSPKKIYNLAYPSTVEINIVTSTGKVLGSGFFIDDNGDIATNYHVIEGMENGYVTIFDGAEYPIKCVVGFNEKYDLAIISIDYSSSKFLKRREGNVITGEDVYALGSSLGLTDSFSSGIISNPTRNIDSIDYIQTTATISQGNSGGPLLDSHGNVVGITTWSYEDGQNINFVIPIYYLDKINKDMPMSVEDFANLSYENPRFRYICVDSEDSAYSIIQMMSENNEPFSYYEDNYSTCDTLEEDDMEIDEYGMYVDGLVENVLSLDVGEYSSAPFYNADYDIYYIFLRTN